MKLHLVVLAGVGDKSVSLYQKNEGEGIKPFRVEVEGYPQSDDLAVKDYATLTMADKVFGEIAKAIGAGPEDMVFG
jgi:hypothetical protein